jgi:hypothetical protein
MSNLYRQSHPTTLDRAEQDFTIYPHDPSPIRAWGGIQSLVTLANYAHITWSVLFMIRLEKSDTLRFL